MSKFLVQVREKEQAMCEYNGGGLCRYCGAEVFWVIRPDGHKLPVNPGDPEDAPLTSHFLTCRSRANARLRRAGHRSHVQRRPGIDHETGEILE